MNDVIISTKNTNTKYKNTGIVCAVIIGVIGFLILCGYFFLSSHSSDDTLIVVLLGGLFFIGDGIITATLRYINASSYVDIYKDRVIGKGIQNFSALDFNLKFEQIGNISVEGIWVHIHTNSGNYKIMTDKKTATEIFNYYNELKG